MSGAAINIVKSFALTVGVGAAAPVFANDGGDRLGNEISRYNAGADHGVGDVHTFNNVGLKFGFESPHGNEPRLNPDTGEFVSEGARTELGDRQTVFVWEDRYDGHFQLGERCSSGAVQIDDSHEVPDGVYLLSVGHCPQISDLTAKGSYVDDAGNEQVSFLRDPIVWTPDTYVDRRVAGTQIPLELEDDISILFYPNAELPDGVVAPRLMTFDVPPLHLKGQHVETGGHDSGLFGFSAVVGGCEITDVGDHSWQVDAEVFKRAGVALGSASQYETEAFIKNQIITDCEAGPGVSGSLVEANINGEKVVVGAISTAIVGGSFSTVSYLTSQHVADAAVFFNDAVGGETETEPVCASVVGDDVHIRDKPGVGANSVGKVSTGRIVKIFEQEGGKPISDGHGWSKVVTLDGQYDGYMAAFFHEVNDEQEPCSTYMNASLDHS